MMQYGYLAALVVSLVGMGVIDWKYKLALWANAGRYGFVLAAAVLFFLAWDAVNLQLGNFWFGQDAKYSFSLVIAGHRFPLEELLFLVMLNYQTILLWRYYECYRTRS